MTDVETGKGGAPKSAFQLLFEESAGSLTTLWNVFETSLPFAWGVINNKFVICLLVTWVLDIVVCGVVGAIQGLIIHGYNGIDWDGEDSNLYLTFLVMLPFPVLWNICQYASFTIQTTGHMTIFGHLKSLFMFGPMLIVVIAISVGAFAGLYFAGVINDENRVFLTIGVSTVPILLGLWHKSTLKNRYISKLFEVDVNGNSVSKVAPYRQTSKENSSMQGSPPAVDGKLGRTSSDASTVASGNGSKEGSSKRGSISDMKDLIVNTIDTKSSLSSKPELLASAAANEGELITDLKKGDVTQTWREFKAPATCFVWTIIFSSGLVLGLGETRGNQIALWGLYLFAFFVLLVGDELLDRVIRSTTGPGMYSLKMIVAFAYIYNTIVNGQIRVIVMNFEEPHRTIGLWAHPLILTALRLVRVYRSSLGSDVEQLEKGNVEVRAEIDNASATNSISNRIAKKWERHEKGSWVSKLLHYAFFMFVKGGQHSLVAETGSAGNGDAANSARLRGLIFRYESVSSRVSRVMLTAVVKMVAANIAVLNAVSIACVLNDEGASSRFASLGTCAAHGYWWDLIVCSVPFFLFDLVEMIVYVYKYKLPLYATFFQLDWFVVVAVVVVNYMAFLLLALAA
jgi:hypothetical protein